MEPVLKELGGYLLISSPCQITPPPVFAIILIPSQRHHVMVAPLILGGRGGFTRGEGM